MKPIWKYNKEKNTVNEIGEWDGKVHMDEQQWQQESGSDKEEWREIWSIIRRLPVSGKVDWIDGQEVVEGKDFNVELDYQIDKVIDVAAPINKHEQPKTAEEIFPFSDYADSKVSYEDIIERMKMFAAQNNNVGESELIQWLNYQVPAGTTTNDLSHDFAENLRNRLDSISQSKINHIYEDVEAAADDFCERHFTEKGKLISIAFKAGAEWQKNHP